MQEFTDYEEILTFCKALASPIRTAIIKQLSAHDQMNIRDLAQALDVTSGALTPHIRLLSEAGIIQIQNANGTKGIQKLCSLKNDRFLLRLSPDKPLSDSLEIEIPVGGYSSHQIRPTCGLATTEHIIGQYDNPLYFDDPERIYANVLWFFSGYVEYSIPNYLESNQKLTEIRISQEISSEAPGFCEHWPSDISFSINGIDIGSWTSPGDFGLHRGIYSPEWWPEGCNQYGLLKTLSVRTDGCYMDHEKISSCTLQDLNIQKGRSFQYRLSVPETAKNVGGLTIFGRNFGNYNQNIQVTFLSEQLTRNSQQ